MQPHKSIIFVLCLFMKFGSKLPWACKSCQELIRQVSNCHESVISDIYCGAYETESLFSLVF